MEMNRNMFTGRSKKIIIQCFGNFLKADKVNVFSVSVVSQNELTSIARRGENFFIFMKRTRVIYIQFDSDFAVNNLNLTFIIYY